MFKKIYTYFYPNTNQTNNLNIQNDDQLIINEDSINDLINEVNDNEGDELVQDTMEGKLKKQTVTKYKVNNSYWKERYFVLEKGILAYYEIQGKDFYNLKNQKIKNVSYKQKSPQLLNAKTSESGYVFTLNIDGNLEIILATKTEHNMEKWFNAFENFLKSEDFSVPALKGEVYIKKGEYWSLIHLSFEKGVLEITRRIQKGFFQISNGKLEINDKDKFSFSIISEDGKIINLSALSKSDMNKWVSSISFSLNNSSGYIIRDNLLEVKMVHEIQNVMLREKELLEEKEKLINSLTPEEKKMEVKIEINEDIEIKIEEGGETPSPTTTPITQPSIIQPPSSQPPPKQRKKFFILSLEGGGCRGLMSSIILERIVEIFPDFVEKIDFFAGTSNGAMTAAALAFGHLPSSCRQLLELTSRVIFKESKKAFKGIKQAIYDNKFLKTFCDEVWKENKMKNAKKHLLVPSFLLDNHHDDPFQRKMEISVVDNCLPNDLNSETLVSDVVMRTISAPTYFKAYQNHIDGGLFAQTPCDLAMLAAMNKLGIDKEDIVLLSIGTGQVNTYFKTTTDFDWGYTQWIPKLSTVLWSGMVDKSDFICQQMLGDRFFKISPLLESDIPLDDPNQIELLVKVAKKVDLFPTLKWINEHFYQNSIDPVQPNQDNDGGYHSDPVFNDSISNFSSFVFVEKEIEETLEIVENISSPNVEQIVENKD